MEQNTEDTPIQLVHQNLWDELAKSLDPELSISKNWRNLAGNLGYTVQDVLALESRQSKKGSNTIKLLEDHIRKVTGFTIAMLRQELENIDRPDAVSVIDTYNKEYRDSNRSMSNRSSCESNPESGFDENVPTPPTPIQHSWSGCTCDCHCNRNGSCCSMHNSCSSHGSVSRMMMADGTTPQRVSYCRSVSDNNRQSPRQGSRNLEHSNSYCGQSYISRNTFQETFPNNLKSTDNALRSFVNGEDDVFQESCVTNYNSMEVDPCLSEREIPDTDMSMTPGNNASFVPFEVGLMRTQLGDNPSVSFQPGYATKCETRPSCMTCRSSSKTIDIERMPADVNQNLENNCPNAHLKGACYNGYHTIPKCSKIRYESSKPKPEPGGVDRSQSVCNTKLHDFKTKVERRSSIFLHYIVDSEETKNYVGSLAMCSSKNGFSVSADIYDKDIPSDNTRVWLEDRFSKADFVIVVVSPGFKDYIEQNYKNGYQNFDGLHAHYICSLMHQEYKHNSYKRFIPVLLPHTRENHIPNWLKSQHRYNWPNDYRDLFMLLWQPHRSLNIQSLVAGRN